MADQPDQPSPTALAVQWVARITTISLEIVLPGLAGYWLDEKINTQFFVLLGFGLGLVIGMWHLLLMTGAIGHKDKRGEPPPPPNHRDSPP